MQTPTFNPRLLLQALSQHRVDYIVIGGVCAVLHGAPVTTLDLDLVHSREPKNLERLLAVLQELDAYYREQPHRRLRPGLSHLASPGHQLLTTQAGLLDLLGTLTAGQGYEDLLPHTVEVRLTEDLIVRVLDLPTLIAVKEAAGRDKDKAVLPILRRTLEEKEKA
jgi:hypothetical protein